MAQSIFTNEILQSFYNLLPYLPFFFDDDVSFAIVDKDEYLKVQNSDSLKFKIKKGDKVPEGGAIAEALETGNVVIRDVPKEVYGIPFKSYAVPIKDHEGRVQGAVVVGKSITTRTEVVALARSVHTSLEEISASIQELSSGVGDVVEMNSEVLSSVQEASENTKHTNEILNFVHGISSQTNLLGLNAAIEASRAGESGRGFNIVAKEIRKLSTSTSESIKSINSVLKNIEDSIRIIDNAITESTTIFKDQADNLEKITYSIKELNSKAQTLESLSKKL
ncbi:methyl-accepting chemotaxis protein [Clostridium sp. WILCCON 0269]|uniref:Methyl-accepting chemotaxis protein n=1 Tax=Candidatus Clostridium eludens TaxID=3381663 RepID=A0ABW8SIL6_9CLOT